MGQVFTKSQVLPTGLDSSAETLTEGFEDNFTNPLVCSNANEVLIAVDWKPGGEDYIEIMPVFSADKSDGQFYHTLRQNDDATGAEVGENKILRVRQDAIDEPPDGDSTEDGEDTHFFIATFKVRGTHVKFGVRCGMDDPAEALVDPGTIKLHYSVKV